MKQVQHANSPKEIFKITGWHKFNGVYANPPIKHDGLVYVDANSKALALRRALLERRSADEDVSQQLDPIGYQAKLQVQETVEMIEVEHCLVNSANTAPGIDGISTEILRACWNSIKDAVLLLFRQCLRQGYLPSFFRTSEVVFLPKPKKRDLSYPNSWRPIALLSCLGKGLERLLARRISHVAITQKVLSKQHFGALPKRSSTDLFGCLIHDIEIACSKGKLASLLTVDVKGAFDTVLPGRLKHRLLEQGWPFWLIRWVDSFMNNRIARIRMEDLVTQGSPLKCGLPQGSPVSPILFMLYIDLLKLSNPKGIFGYADDIAFLRTGKTLLQCAGNLQKDLEMIREWGKQNAITFDPDKSELQHFTQAPKPKDYPSIRHEDWNIIPNQETRWLGVWLDRKLSFLSHVRKWPAKTSAAEAHLRRLNNTQQGSRPDLIRQAIKSCVISTAFFGTEAW